MSRPAHFFARDGVSVWEDGRVFTLCIDRGECRINPTSIELLSEALAVVEKAPHPKALVITGTGKFFGNGLDMDFLLKKPQETTWVMIESFWRVLARVLTLDCHSVCAINGHAFGAGLFLALCCDWRIMRTKQGFLNFPELSLGMRLSIGFVELAKAKLTPAALRAGVLTGQRFDSSSALSHGIIDAECPSEDLERRARTMAEGLLPARLNLRNFKSKAFSEMKVELYTDAYRALKHGRMGQPADSKL